MQAGSRENSLQLLLDYQRKEADGGSGVPSDDEPSTPVPQSPYPRHSSKSENRPRDAEAEQPNGDTGLEGKTDAELRAIANQKLQELEHQIAQEVAISLATAVAESINALTAEQLDQTQMEDLKNGDESETAPEQTLLGSAEDDPAEELDPIEDKALVEALEVALEVAVEEAGNGALAEAIEEATEGMPDAVKEEVKRDAEEGHLAEEIKEEIREQVAEQLTGSSDAKSKPKVMPKPKGLVVEPTPATVESIPTIVEPAQSSRATDRRKTVSQDICPVCVLPVAEVG